VLSVKEVSTVQATKILLIAALLFGGYCVVTPWDEPAADVARVTVTSG
jgi:hypothetical protein